jgi:hypothetical protein
MALSKPVQNKEVTTKLDSLFESIPVLTDILFSFREFHDLCVRSRHLPDHIVIKVDQCAVDFRQMSLNTVTVSKRVSNQWLDSAIALFENIEQHENPCELLQLLADQARELSQCFRIIAAWARDLEKKLHAAQDLTIRQLKGLQVTTARADNDGTEQPQEDISWGTWFKSFLPTLETATAKPSIKEKIEKTPQYENEKLIAEKAGMLNELLRKRAEVHEAIADFWKEEAEKYELLRAKIETAKFDIVQIMTDSVSQNNIRVWKEAKQSMERHATSVTKISNCFNFVTPAKPCPAEKKYFPSLQLTLNVPSCIGSV